MPAPTSPQASAPAAAPTPAAPAAPKTPPADAVTVNTNTDQVAFRGAPSLSGPLLRRFALNEALTSLESKSDTLAKIGVNGQWLNVQASDRTQGYVAAWYVQSGQSGGAPAAGAPAPATGAPLTVKVIEDQLAFRSQPAISDTNLISRFPLNAILTVDDPDANQKIGVMNQWLKVKDSTGKEGYVAAWYVSK